MPKKNKILYVKGMNLPESDSDDEDSYKDIWDDRKLNEAYDKGLKIANAKVAKKKGGLSIKKEELSNKGKSPKNRKKNQNQTVWKVGMPCRAVYKEDGVEYEALVLGIIDHYECVVRFLGYENLEIVSISTLEPTLGTEERTRQIEEALDERSHLGREQTAKKKKNPSSRQSNSFDLPAMPFAMPDISALRSAGAMDMPLPLPPPPLPMDDRGRCDSEEQAISSMLLSWYTSGYRTGLYQGMKRAKESRRNI